MDVQREACTVPMVFTQHAVNAASSAPAAVATSMRLKGVSMGICTQFTKKKNSEIYETHVHSSFSHHLPSTKTMSTITIYQPCGRKDEIRLRNGTITKTDAVRISDGWVNGNNRVGRNVSVHIASISYGRKWRDPDMPTNVLQMWSPSTDVTYMNMRQLKFFPMTDDDGGVDGHAPEIFRDTHYSSWSQVMREMKTEDKQGGFYVGYKVDPYTVSKSLPALAGTWNKHKRPSFKNIKTWFMLKDTASSRYDVQFHYLYKAKYPGCLRNCSDFTNTGAPLRDEDYKKLQTDGTPFIEFVYKDDYTTLYEPESGSSIFETW